MAWFRFELAQPLPLEIASYLKALSGVRPAWNKRSVEAGPNAAWLAQEALQHYGVPVRRVISPPQRGMLQAIPRIPDFKEYVSGLEGAYPNYLMGFQTELLLTRGHVNGVHLWWAPGCLSGETELTINRGGKAFRLTLAELVRRFNGGRPSRGPAWDPTILTMTQSRTDDGLVRLNQIVGAYESGVKETWLVTTKRGYKIRATKDHRFLQQTACATWPSWTPLQKLWVGAEIIVEVGQGTGRAPQPKAQYDYTLGLHHHPYAIRYERTRKDRPSNNRIAKVATHRLVAEAELNGLTFETYITRLKRIDLVGLKFLDPNKWEVHHRDGHTRNNLPSNLEVFAKDGSHQREHAITGRWRDVLYRTDVDEIVSIDSPREEMTYDLSMADPHNNFLANRIVVHNSGKTVGCLSWAMLDPAPIVFVTKSAARKTIAADVKRFTEASCTIIAGQKPGALPLSRVYIIGWDTLQYHVEELMKINPGTVVFDEIHRGKSHKRWMALSKKDDDGKTQIEGSGDEKIEFKLRENMTSAAMQLSRASSVKRRIGATGSAIKDRLRDLWAQLDLIEPWEWGNFYDFTKRYCQGHAGLMGGFDSSGRASHPYINELLKRLSLSVHMVPYSVTHANLPPKRRQVTYISKADLLKDEGSEARKALAAAANHGTNAMASARLAASAARKRNTLVDAVVDTVGEKSKIVVITGLVAEVGKLRDAIAKKLPQVSMWAASGMTSVKDRDVIREAYMDHPGPCILVGSMGAWGESIQLHDTDVAHIGMLPFTPGEVIQLEGRFTRQGQKRPCLLHYHVAEGTYDEHVAQLLLDKLPAVERITGGGELDGFGKSLAGVENEEELIAALMAKVSQSDVEIDDDSR